jgi:hypothetical protein
MLSRRCGTPPGTDDWKDMCDWLNRSGERPSFHRGAVWINDSATVRAGEWLVRVGGPDNPLPWRVYTDAAFRARFMAVDT